MAQNAPGSRRSSTTEEETLNMGNNDSLTAFLCPSDTVPNWFIQGTNIQIENIKAPGSNYFGSLGSSYEYDSSWTGGPPNGVFSYLGSSNNSNPAISFMWASQSFRPVTLAGVQDGTSNTVAFAEWRIMSFNPTGFDADGASSTTMDPRNARARLLTSKWSSDSTLSGLRISV
jgi:hypothetical protein